MTGLAAASPPSVPFYRAIGREKEILRAAASANLPVLLKGPTGCGKSRFVEAMAHELGRPLLTVACNEETSAVDLCGRHLVVGGDTVWQDGPAVRAARAGAILYLDEIAEARADVLVVIHPLADHRRQLWIDRRNEVVTAAPGFLLVASFNPGYQGALKELKPSTRQRFVTLAFDWPEPGVEAEIVAAETGADAATCRRLCAFARKVRSQPELGLAETVSTRLLVAAGRLIRAGVPPRAACEAAIVQPLSDDRDVAAALTNAVALAF
ncbi:MAG: CbbQ/NirQ/NorQ/GpvN family protein [Planctomycetes bacterium]|nr:CbbQ/NirQ/NorQ/GpvN family protein [Planctomycetota bacterium]